jgi:hypothetical protein
MTFSTEMIDIIVFAARLVKSEQHLQQHPEPRAWSLS